MGACTFQNHVTKNCFKSAKEAFTATVEEALHMYGHAGYTGTIAEKNDFVMVGRALDWDSASHIANGLLSSGDKRVDDKWGPAGCVEVVNEDRILGWLFFGWASE